MLADARRQTNIFHKDAEPFQLEADFVAQIQTPLQGHITIKWESNDHWWNKITLVDFVEINVRNGEKEYTSRNGSFTPERVAELIHLLYFANRSAGAVKKQKQQVENGVQLTCMHVDEKAIEHTLHEICLNSSNEISNDESIWGIDQTRIERYSDYADFKGHRYPRKLELLANGSKVLTVTVTSLMTAAFDQALLEPPKGAVERNRCKNFKHALPVKTPDPLYPKSASQNEMMGDTSVVITVETDGSVSNVHLLGGATQSMDEATLKTIKGWKFKPATCGPEPVVSDLQVVVSFRLH